MLAHSKMHESAGEAPAQAQPQAPRRRLFRCNFCAERFERRWVPASALTPAPAPRAR